MIGADEGVGEDNELSGDGDESGADGSSGALRVHAQVARVESAAVFS
jgi:hypothetical protein